MKSLGIYIHIPFCVKKCAYCDFYSLCHTSEAEESYIDALCNHITVEAPLYSDYTVDTVFLGGGTPSVLSPRSIDKLFVTLENSFKFTQGAEFTAEANPGTLTKEKLLAFKNHGVNRLSIGLQSSDFCELSRLARIHTLEDFESSMALARECGFENISVDIMYGLPEQKLSNLEKTIDYVCAFSPTHISAYCLKIEENTPFGKMQEMLSLPDEDEEYEMYMRLCHLLAERGYLQYEISNFSKEGYRSRHNLKYWQGEEYLSFGPSSHSFVGGVRYSYPRDISAYIEGTKKGIPYRQTEKETEPLIKMEQMDEYVMLRLRLSDGIDLKDFKATFCTELFSEYSNLKKFIKSGHVVEENGKVHFTPQGFFVSNYILTEILHI